MNIYEELRKKRPAHPSIGPEFRSDSSSSTTTAYEKKENSQQNQQYNYIQQREISEEINFYPTPSSFVTGPPSKNHWKPDSEVSSCADCSRPFTLINRRHHCRRCGDIFCGRCTNFTARLDQDCRFNPKGIESRICRKCNDERQNKTKTIVNNSTPSRYRPKRNNTTPGILREPNNYYNQNSENISINKPAPVPDLAPATLMSVPNDWTWSTF